MDIEILLILQRFRESINGAWNSFFVFISQIAVDYYILVAALIIFWCIDKNKGGRIILTWGGSLCVGAAIKATACVYRPWIKDSRVTPPAEIFAGATGYSFPSGHSFSAGGFWNPLAIAYRKHKQLIIFSIVMVALTMFSRIFLGVHTPQDILVGCAISIACAFGIHFLCNWIDKHPNLDWIVVVASTVLVIGLLFYLRFKSYPMDYDDAGNLLVDPKKMQIDGFKDPGTFYGIVLGWFIERRLIKFNVEGTIKQKIMRGLIGGILVVFWWTAVASPIGKACNNPIVYFVTQMSTPLLFMVVYPLIFSLIEKKSIKKELELEKNE